MSKKDVDIYYNNITHDYKEMLDDLKEMEELCANDIVNPDRVDELKKMIEPLKNNYQTISWIMFLLNSPNKKDKKKSYNKCYTKKMEEIDPNHDRDMDSILKENKSTIDIVNSLTFGKSSDTME